MFLLVGGIFLRSTLVIAGEGDGETGADGADDVSNRETGSSDREQAGMGETELNLGAAGEVTQGGLAEDGDRGCDEGVAESGDEGQIGAKAPNEANFCADVCIVQHQDVIEVPTNSDGVSGLEGCQAKPILLETKPIPAGDVSASGTGGLTKAEARPVTDGERWEARREMRRREWFRSWAEARERERIARVNRGERIPGRLRRGRGKPCRLTMCGGRERMWGLVLRADHWWVTALTPPGRLLKKWLMPRHDSAKKSGEEEGVTQKRRGARGRRRKLTGRGTNAPTSDTRNPVRVAPGIAPWGSRRPGLRPSRTHPFVRARVHAQS